MFCKWCGGNIASSDSKCRRCGKDVPALSDCGGFYDLVPDARKTAEIRSKSVEHLSNIDNAQKIIPNGLTKNVSTPKKINISSANELNSLEEYGNTRKKNEKHPKMQVKSSGKQLFLKEKKITMDVGVVPTVLTVIGFAVLVLMLVTVLNRVNRYSDQVNRLQNDLNAISGKVHEITDRVDTITEKIDFVIEKSENDEVHNDLLEIAEAIGVIMERTEPEESVLAEPIEITHNMLSKQQYLSLNCIDMQE